MSVQGHLKFVALGTRTNHKDRVRDRRDKIFMRTFILQGARAVVEKLAWTLGFVVFKSTCENFAIS